MNETTNSNTATIQPRKAYYLMLGYGGTGSVMVFPYEKTGREDGGYMSLSDCFGGGALKTKPMTAVWRAIGTDGSIHEISDNQLNQAGIGGFREDFQSLVWMRDEDIALLVDGGKYTRDEIGAEFYLGTQYNSDGTEYEEGNLAPHDLTDKMLEMLKELGKLRKEKAEREERERKAKREAKRAEVRKEYAFLPFNRDDGRYLRTGEVSKNLKELLKRRFPNVKFSVRSKSFSGGDDVTVSYVDGPAYAKVKRLVDMFCDSSTDITGDYRDHTPSAFNDVFGGFSYTWTNREISDELKADIGRLITEKFNLDEHDYAIQFTRYFKELTEDCDFPKGAKVTGIEYDTEKESYKLVFEVTPTAEPPKGKKPVDGVLEGSGAIITENKAKGGVEIRFPSKPSADVLNELKRNGWRWTRFNGGLWYNKATDENREFARRFVAA